MKKPIVIVAVAAILLIIGVALAARSLLSGDRIRTVIEAQATAAIGRPVTIQQATPRLFPRVGLELAGVAVGNAREVTIDRIRLSTGLSGLLRRRVQDATIQIERSQIDVRQALALLAALAGSGGTNPSRTASSALTIESIGALGLRDVTLVAGNHTLLVDMDSSLMAGDRFVISRMHGQSAVSNFTMSGELSSVARRTGTFSVDADTLDLDGLLAFLAAATPAGERQLALEGTGRASRAGAVPLHLAVKVRARQGRVLGASLSNLTTSCQVTGGDARLDDLKVEIFGGRYDGTIAFRGSQGEPRYEWRGAVENVDVPQLVNFAGATGSITGRLGGTLSIEAAGPDPQVAMRRARGTARVAITDGRVPGLEIVRAVILAFGRPSSERPPGSGEAFTRLAATLALAGQQLSTNDLSFASRDFEMTGVGTVSLASQAVDLRTDVRLSRELSAQAGRDLYRLAREGDRIVLPARITGAVSSPQVFINVQDALKRALVNRAQDEVKSWLDRLRKRP